MSESLCSSPIGAQTMYHDQRSKWTDWPQPWKFSQSAGFLKLMAFAVPAVAAAGRDWNIFHSLLPFSWEAPPPLPPLAASLQSGHCIPKCTPDAKIPGISLCGEVREDWEAVGQVKVNGCLYCRTSQSLLFAKGHCESPRGRQSWHHFPRFIWIQNLSSILRAKRWK